MKIKPIYPKKIFIEPYYNGVYTGFMIGASLIYLVIGNYVPSAILFGVGIMSNIIYRRYIYHD